MVFPSQAGVLPVVVMAVAAWLGALLGLAPVVVAMPTGMMPMVYGYFLGAGLRVGLGLLAVVVGVKVLAMPAGPVAVTLLAVYLPLLWIESSLIGRQLWRRSGPAGGAPTIQVEQPVVVGGLT